MKSNIEKPKTMKPNNKKPKAMKTNFIKHALASIGILLAIGATTPSYGSLASEVVKRVIRAGGHVVDDASQIAAKEAVKKGIAKYGDEVAEMTESGGFGLVEAAVTHGDDVWRLAKIGPEMPRALAGRTESLLKVAKQWGDDAARIEARAPGCGEALGATAPKKWLTKLAADASPTDLQRIASFAVHQTPRETVAMVKIWSRSGSRAIQLMTPARIASFGFAGALLVSAWQAPEAALGLAEASLTGFLGPLITVCSWVIVLVVLTYLRKPLLWLTQRAVSLAKSIWRNVRHPNQEPLKQLSCNEAPESHHLN
ncbi:MAG: hypothetical protein H7A51_19355 [Akkermansiaceae bacterium]|nr:hypothetical protein [Akkermansiaceae bacterium]